MGLRQRRIRGREVVIPIDSGFDATQRETTRYSTRKPPRILFAAALMVSLVVAGACDLGSISDGPPANCSESGVLCQLASGPLGVCERTQCGPDHTPPCFQCTPQH